MFIVELTMSIQREFVLRYREYGHVRFQIPQVVCEEAIAKSLSDSLSIMEGVKAVRLFRAQRKLSIRYNETICDFSSLAKQLFQILAELDRKGWFQNRFVAEAPVKQGIPLKQRLGNSKVGRWVSEKFQAVKETAQAAKILGKLTAKGPKALIKDPEKATINFLNDILVLYLIKIHWERITKHWLVRPLTYRYEWLAVFYMFFLLVRSRQKR